MRNKLGMHKEAMVAGTEPTRRRAVWSEGAGARLLGFRLYWLGWDPLEGFEKRSNRTPRVRFWKQFLGSAILRIDNILK